MSSAILNLLAPSGAAAPDPATGSPTVATPGTESFDMVLSGKLHAVRALKVPAPETSNDSTKLAALEAKIRKMLKAGASERDVTALLATDLSASVAPALGGATPAGRIKLQAAFAAALDPPADAKSAGSSGSRWQSAAALQIGRAKALAQRFLQVQAIATSIVNGQTFGQQNPITGTFLDAGPAKETPAHNPTAKPASAILRGLPRVSPLPAVAADSDGSAAPNLRPTTAAAVSSVPAAFAPVAAALQASVTVSADSVAAGDGRTVKLGAKPAIAAGGDTVLGRVLTRAALAADARETPATPPAAVSAVDPDANPVTPANPALPAVSTLDAATDATLDPALDASSDGAVAAFVTSFEAALGTAKPMSQSAHQADQPTATVQLSVTANDSSNAAPAFVPALAPFSIERTSPVALVAAPVHAEPIDHSAIVDQVLRGAFMRNTGASSEIRLSLVPQTLGDVNVKLTITAGNVAAHVVAATPEVRDALVAAQPQLSKSLADAGLKLQSFNVDLSGSGFAGFSQQQGQQPQTGNRARNPDLPAADEFDDLRLDAVPSFGPSILASTRTGDYNYLA